MYDMNPVSVRELQRAVGTILARVEKGESIDITRRGRPVARIVPLRPQPPEPWPDLTARAEAVMGRRQVVPPGSQQLSADRGER